MELFKLDSSYLPGTTFNKYVSLVWTERYDQAGDFELVIENDISILALFSIGTLLSHTDTKEVMIVENHEISRDKDKKLTVKITGRSFETFAENRNTAGSDLALKDGSGNANTEVLTAMSSSAAAVHILKDKLEPGTASSDDAIPNLLVTEDVDDPDASVEYQIKRGDVYSQVLEFLKINNTGIRVSRPNGAQTTLNITVHSGVDRSTEVIFYAQQQDLEDAQYFQSNKKYRNYARVSANTATRLYRHRDLGSDLTGLNRRILYVEVTDLEGDFDPPSDTDAIAGRGQAALDSNRYISLIQAKISTTAKPKFKYSYDVGDIVLVFGEFQTAQYMRVTEHILTSDKDGLRGYPALSAL